MKYRFMKSGEETEVCALVSRSFNEFVAPGYSQEGVDEFLKYAQPDSLLRRSQTGHFVVVAQVQDTIVGMVEVRGNKHISMLFVDKNFQQRGIGKELVKKSLEIAQSNNPELAQMSINSSPYAVPIYEKLGFRKKEPEQMKNGIRFTPMVLILPKGDGGYQFALSVY